MRKLVLSAQHPRTHRTVLSRCFSVTDSVPAGAGQGVSQVTAPGIFWQAGPHRASQLPASPPGPRGWSSCPSRRWRGPLPILKGSPAPSHLPTPQLSRDPFIKRPRRQLPPPAPPAARATARPPAAALALERRGQVLRERGRSSRGQGRRKAALAARQGPRGPDT
jgi:hypothetical protein